MKAENLLAVAFVFLPSAASAGSVDVQAIIAKSIVVNDADWKAQSGFDFTERDKTKTGTKTYRVMMILGSPYYRLLAINGNPLPSDAEKEEQGRLARTTALRQAESPEQRAARIALYEKERQRDHLLLSQLTVAFNFMPHEGQRLGPYDVYVLHATPRAGYQPPNMECEALAGMEGTLWIDKANFQWVKVEAHVVRPVSIEGFLARVEPGTRFELDQGPVTENLWLPTHFAMRSHAKILGLWNHRTRDDETYFKYQRVLTSPSATK